MKRLLIITAICAACLSAQLAMSSGAQTVTTSGTAVTLTSVATPFKSGTIQAKAANTGIICIGGANVLASSKNGVCLAAGLAEPLYAIPGYQHDLSKIYIDASVSGEGASFQYEN